MNVSLIIALIIIVLIILYMVGNWFINKRAVTELDQNEFHNGLRKAQVIDVREKVDYDYGHINGARNIPMSMFSQRYQGLRKDQPIYLCDANGVAGYRAARILKKNGYTNIYMLKGGYKKWTGKIKTKK
ncbi:rhodanese-like domain-containing protein [Staphylococcus devriesei]|uniref:Rhodanese-like domain-containing protein n=1 Tax=Staphylococcus devriesei TaxID=586733 RepID=A0A2K4DGZ5_9STAP|nr:rhodanese-like domain-containing protein [Staphylococcus devriesei]MCE5089772.1 rhodanese-like domain-containing protein [Staphylococcus devriesei]MCE5097455.1 rhodanese-like domain-containing protein [Staphylococcus devriesei]PNZ86093.1 rhodanese [Staphylococcus devriesei]PTE72662.1 rhodanese-like domain-containing protein [Staphylococcus devriesei]PTF01515.1 rhodanese-like domain-containing protein [Staphylococcus devriesei]